MLTRLRIHKSQITVGNGKKNSSIIKIKKIKNCTFMKISHSYFSELNFMNETLPNTSQICTIAITENAEIQMNNPLTQDLMITLYHMIDTP